MLKSPLFLAILGTLLGIATTAGVILMSLSSITDDEKTKTVKLPDPTNAPRDWVFWTDEINKLSGDLKDEREAIEERRKELDQFEARLISEREELRKVRTELEGIRREVTETIPKMESSEKQNIKTLAKTYATMKPQDAVAILRELDDPSLVKILASMKADVVGAIFQEMAKARDNDSTLAARAARISEQLRLVRNEPKAAAQP